MLAPKTQKNAHNETQIQSQLKKTLSLRLSQIHSKLCKLGCPLISPLPQTFMQNCELLLQVSDSRIQLIEWLIAIIYPGYNLDENYKNIYDNNPHLNKVKKLSIVLWELGVMPVSKHTKNLDYNGYIEGVLGCENAIALLYDLCELAVAKFSNIKDIENDLGDLLGDLIRNKNQLVNVDYDPYGVVFPSKYYSCEEDQDDLQKRYAEMFEELSQNNGQNNQTQQQQDNFGVLFENLDTFKQIYKRKYKKLVQQMHSIIGRYENIVPTQNLQDISTLHNKRMIKVSKNLCKKYKQYVKVIQNIPQRNFDNKVKQLQKEAINLINSINEINDIFL